MTSHQPFENLFITPVLPFRADGSIDEDSYRGLLRHFLTEENIEAGVAIIANPEAGEIFVLDREERRRVIQIVLEEVGGRTPVLAGVVDVTTAGMVQTARDAADLGVDGLFVFPPIGAGDITLSWDPEANPEVFLDLLKEIAAAVDLPQVIHPIGKLSIRYGVGLSAGITERIIQEVPQVVAWKMTYNYDGYREITRVLRAADRPIGIYAASGKYMHENLANDAFDGTSSGAFNYALEPMLAHIGAWRSGDIDAANKIWHAGLAQLQEYVFADFGRLHIRYKMATWLRGLISSPVMRAPAPLPRRGEIDILRRLLTAAGVTTLSEDEVAAALTELGIDS